MHLYWRNKRHRQRCCLKKRHNFALRNGIIYSWNLTLCPQSGSAHQQASFPAYVHVHQQFFLQQLGHTAWVKGGEVSGFLDCCCLMFSPDFWVFCVHFSGRRIHTRVSCQQSKSGTRRIFRVSQLCLLTWPHTAGKTSVHHACNKSVWITLNVV